jgi:hypothetical protein
MGPGGDVWSDFVGGGSSVADYANDPSVYNPKNAQELGIDISNGFKSGASYSQACTKMDSTSNYALEGADCSSNARFICIKPCKNSNGMYLIPFLVISNIDKEYSNVFYTMTSIKLVLQCVLMDLTF